MIVRVVRHGDAVAFMNRAGTWLLQTEAEHSLILGIAQAFRAEACYFATIEQDAVVVGCAVRTPGRNLIITRMPPSTVMSLAVDADACFHKLPGVIGPPAAAREFASRWCDRHGLEQRDAMQQRIYRLVRVRPPDRRVPGELRFAEARDTGLVTSWVESFAAEAGVPASDAVTRVPLLIAKKEMALWHDGRPRSLAGYSGRSPRGVRIGYVYTPPEWRSRGYATATVAALSQLSLDAGAAFCCLYTDLSNPTSNAIYQRIGYEPVSDSVDISFFPVTS